MFCCSMSGRSGLEIISDLHQLAPDCRVVILTVFEDEEKISRAISAGASGYLLKTSRAETVAEMDDIRQIFVECNLRLVV